MMQMLTWTLRFCISASAAATIVLTAARFRYFLEGSSAAPTRIALASNIERIRDMGNMISAVAHVWQLALLLGGRIVAFRRIGECEIDINLGNNIDWVAIQQGWFVDPL